MKNIFCLILFYSIAISGNVLSQNNIVKIFEAEGSDAQDKAVNKLFQANRKIVNYQGTSPFIKSAGQWLERKFTNWYSYHEEYSVVDIHPSPGLELCIYVDDGILVFNIKGKLLGKIDYNGTNINVDYVELDFLPNIPSISLKEVIIKESDVDGSFIIKILKYYDGEYLNIFSMKFNDSLWEQYISHPIFECIKPVPLKNGSGLITNDEGKLKYWKYSLILKKYEPVPIEKFLIDK